MKLYRITLKSEDGHTIIEYRLTPRDAILLEEVAKLLNEERQSVWQPKMEVVEVVPV